jgi:hypothetical protein
LDRERPGREPAVTQHPRVLAEELAELVVETLLNDGVLEGSGLIEPGSDGAKPRDSYLYQDLVRYLENLSVQRDLREALQGWLERRPEAQ